MNSIKPLLEVKNLVVNFETEYGRVQAVRDISLSLEKGETLAIVGESGCGKSVLCKSMLRILTKTGVIANGEVHLEGKDLAKLSQKEMDKIRGKDISMIFQDPMTSLNPTLSIGKQIMEAVLIHQKMSKREAKERTIELMALVGIADAEKRFHQYPHHFSGGMRQRSVIAIALACNPKVLIADEPTTALDVTIQVEILELLKILQKTLGMAMLFITHDFGVVAKIAQRVAVMYAGKIVEIGTVQEIFEEARHPYTKGLMFALPRMDEQVDYLRSIAGLPPDLVHPPKGDAFASRNQQALRIDYREEPPMFRVSDTHSAATWLLHPDAPSSLEDAEGAGDTDENR